MALINRKALAQTTGLAGDDVLLVLQENVKQTNAGNKGITVDNFVTAIESRIDDVVGDLDITGTLTVDTISEHTADAGVTVESVKIENGGLSNTAETAFAGFFFTAAQNNITAGTGGAISVANYLTTINTDAGGDAFTLANGIQRGQLKKIQLVVDGGGDAVITPATPMVFGYTTITMNDAGDFVILQWSGSAWFCIENSGATLA